MPRLNLEQMIQGYSQMNPEQINLLRWFYSQFDNASAAHRTILNVEPLFYIGASGGSEFITYAATKLYLAFDFEVGTTSANVPNSSANSVTVYNEANAIMLLLHNLSVTFRDDTVAFLYAHNNINRKNFYFSRVTTGQYVYMIFNGFRITLN